jgi:hypothetical protein
MEQRSTRAAVLRGDFLYCTEVLQWSLLSATLVAIFLSLSSVIGLLGNRNAFCNMLPKQPISASVSLLGISLMHRAISCVNGIAQSV